MDLDGYAFENVNVSIGSDPQLYAEITITGSNYPFTTVSSGGGDYFFIKENCCSPGQSNDPEGNDLFALAISYDKLNIKNLTWQTACHRQAYDFFYDPLHRLTIAGHKDYEINHDGQYDIYLDRYNVSVNEYDPIGNIKRLRRNGLNTATNQYEPIDIMTYSYLSNGRLGHIVDDALPDQGFQGNSAYSYNDNGALIEDTGKGFETITNNHFNLPQTVSGTSGTINYIYDASGRKLKKIGADANGDELIKDYGGITEYSNGELTAVYHPEGRLVRKNFQWFMEYFLKDHLGNTRVVFSDLNGDGVASLDEKLQENHYYPFGMETEGTWNSEADPEENHLYNGKERDKDLGLNLDHYGFRMYDASIGRFTGVDPIADQFAHVSTYNYAENSPIGNIDLWGLQAWDATNMWNGSKILEYREFSVERVASYINNNDEFTCEDLCLSVVMEFAHENQLPFKFQIDDKVYDSSSTDYKDYETFANDVLTHSGARHVERNTNLKTLNSAQPGDVILSKDHSSTSLEMSNGHVNFITKAEGNIIDGYQGNYGRPYGTIHKILDPFGSAYNPAKSSYVGSRLQAFNWNLESDIYYSEKNQVWGSPQLNFSTSKNRAVREFDFLNWNN